ncbi:hypothetical protein ACH5AR_13935 [Kitasatospora sp. NPDC018619]|uniref:hypothetical protein n=1 Tax=Kitasatospora sp. NPDC018619 TaxID=3364028 RepID=UPI0037B00AA6
MRNQTGSCGRCGASSRSAASKAACRSPVSSPSNAPISAKAGDASRSGTDQTATARPPSATHARPYTMPMRVRQISWKRLIRSS